jgi:predicted DNA-binding antitoxin AbrB/MazE fold protein
VTKFSPPDQVAEYMSVHTFFTGHRPARHHRVIYCLHVSSRLAVYENGSLRLSEPLSLPQGTKVLVYVAPRRSKSSAQLRRALVHHALVHAGLSQPAQKKPRARRLTSERRERLAALFAQGKPLSQIILEEREGR